MLDVGDDGENITFLGILEQWVLVEFDFQHVLSIDLEELRNKLSWRRFELLLAGLFGVEKSLVRSHFRPDKNEQEDGAQNQVIDNDE